MSEQPLPIEPNKTPEQIAQIQQIMQEFHQELDNLKVARDTAIDTFIKEKKTKRIQEIRQSILN